MTSPRHRPTAAAEPLEGRIAPALAVLNPLPDVTAGSGFNGASVDLSRLFDQFVTDNGHTMVSIQTNFDADPLTAGIQVSEPIVLELYDDLAPLTVQNFLHYLNNPDTAADYIGTFFHRAVEGFVLQGGGFNAATPSDHIKVDLNLHNEFDPARSNVEGTIAMAKLGIDPNTATSEWFINLADNSENLDEQNGGFSVFGRVVSGMGVAKAIVQLPVYTTDGDTPSWPVQNYTFDPGLPPGTVPVQPTADQLITVLSKTVTPPPSGAPNASITYSFNPAVDVVDAISGLPSDVIGGSVSGSTLQLQVKAGGSGMVRVTIHGSDGTGGDASDTFLVDVRPNLVASFVDDPFDGVILGGDQKESKLVIGNSGGGWASGPVNVKVYLSEVRTDADPNGLLVQPGEDLLLGTFNNESLNLASGATATLTKTLGIPKQLVTKTGGVYRILIQVEPADGSIGERFTDDNVSLDGDSHRWENLFGDFNVPGYGERKGATVTYVEPDGDTVSFGITRGAGRVAFDGTLADLVILSAKEKSVLSTAVQAAPGAPSGHEASVDLAGVEVLGYMADLDLSAVSLAGSLSAPYGVAKLRLGDASGGVLSMGNFPEGKTAAATIRLQSVADFSVDSLVKLNVLSALEWRNTDSTADLIKAPGIGTLKISGRAADGAAPAIRGDLEADMQLGGKESLKTLSVAGLLHNATLSTHGKVGTVDVGGLDHANLLVGYKSLPGPAAEVKNGKMMESISIRGLGGGASAFIDSNVAAKRIDSVFVKSVDPDGDAGHFGFVADVIKAYNRGNVFKAGVSNEPQVFDKLGDYRVRIV